MQPILILYTGGTIGMEKADNGKYQPTAGFESLAQRTIAPIIWAQMPPHKYVELVPAIDSADITPLHWQQMATSIVEHYDDYAGFIILHGTDTMAYSASMLSFLLGELDKPVIFTGSQIPLTEPCSDGANNLLVALQIIAQTRIAEVCIYFANQLFRGNRATKISTSAMVAFESTNYPILGAFENRLKLFCHRWMPAAPPRFAVPTLVHGSVAVIYLTPGMPSEIMTAAINGHAKGLVLVSYGSGNIPLSNVDFLNALQQAHQRNIIIVNVSQCLGGHVGSDYAASKPLHESGVVNGEDMTIEAAVTKLYYLLSVYGTDYATIKSYLVRDLRGEMTPRQ